MTVARAGDASEVLNEGNNLTVHRDIVLVKDRWHLQSVCYVSFSVSLCNYSKASHRDTATVLWLVAATRVCESRTAVVCS